MKIKTRENYSTPAARARLAQFLSITIEGRKDESFAPYMANKGDDSYWKLDSGNDWGLGFFNDQPDVFEIRYRYQCEANQFEEALAGWLVVRIGTISY